MRLTLRNHLRIAHAAVTRSVPVYAHFGITHRCGLTCKMCGIWRYGNKREELTLPEMAEVAARMKRIGVVQVSIGGGEPFEREDLPEVLRAFVDQGLNVRCLTNGVTTAREQIDATVAAGCVNYSVSLDSLYPERYDYICEQPESWTRGVRTMTYIAEKTLPLGGLPTINCVVSNLNLEELPDMVRFAQAIGFHVSFLPIELLPDPKAGVRNWEGRFIRYRPEMGLHQNQSPEQVLARIDEAYSALIAMKKDGMPILNSTPYLERSRDYLKTGRFPAEGCDAGRLYFSVAPNGQFTICHRTQHQHVSFLDPDFEAYWYSRDYERKRAHEAASCEGCMRACWIDTSSMFRNLEGFFETAALNLRTRRRGIASYNEALLWAKQGSAVVPTETAQQG